ncbi:hypothetical protein HaLaN_03673, partial [Haematococcus lacustris]
MEDSTSTVKAILLTSGPPNSDEFPSTPQHTLMANPSFSCGSAEQVPKHHISFLPTVPASSPP